MKHWRKFLWVSSISAGLSVADLASGQPGPFQKAGGVLQKGANSDQSARVEDPLRAVEIEIELALLADPATCPYHLEVRAKGMSMEVRGTVPSKKIAEHALKIARLQTTLSVVSAFQESPRVLANPVRLPSAQLQSSAQNVLREALPRQAKNLQTQCGPDGVIQVSGVVPSLEQKLAVSRALRRLHGCTSVVNLTQFFPGDGIVPLTPSRVNTASLPPGEKREAQKGLLTWFVKSSPPIEQAKEKQPSPIEAPMIQPVVQKELPPIQPKTTITPGMPAPTQWTQANGNSISRVTAVMPTRERTVSMPANYDNRTSKTEGSSRTDGNAKTDGNSKTTAANARTAARLKRRIEEACPRVRDVQVTFTSAAEVKVELRARPGDDIGQLAGQILSLRELEALRPDLHIQVPEK